MIIQEGYTINQSLSQVQVEELWQYITGSLCDLYGASTWLSGYPEDTPTFPNVFKIKRYNRLPLFPAVDTILEIVVEKDMTNVEAYFYSKWKRNKVVHKLEEISDLKLTPRPVAWKQTDIEKIVASARDGSYWLD